MTGCERRWLKSLRDGLVVDDGVHGRIFAHPLTIIACELLGWVECFEDGQIQSGRTWRITAAGLLALHQREVQHLPAPNLVPEVGIAIEDDPTSVGEADVERGRPQPRRYPPAFVGGDHMREHPLGLDPSADASQGDQRNGLYGSAFLIGLDGEPVAQLVDETMIDATRVNASTFWVSTWASMRATATWASPGRMAGRSASPSA
jgi:hypothetical protein